MIIREASEEDFEEIEKILDENSMLVPEIDGKHAMKKIKKNMGKYFLVAEDGGEVLGFIRAVYDGSRALIHQMAVRKPYQKRGIGKNLILELCKKLKEDGAPTVSVTVTENSSSYYENLSFKKLPITLMLAEDIDKVINISSKYKKQK